MSTAKPKPERPVLPGDSRDQRPNINTQAGLIPHPKIAEADGAATRAIIAITVSAAIRRLAVLRGLRLGIRSHSFARDR